jgi:hypothetical protein
MRVNAITRGWVNYFRVGNSSRAFGNVRFDVERGVRRFVARKSQRKGFGWKRWSNDVVYGRWGLFSDYRIVYTRAKARTSRTES